MCEQITVSLFVFLHLVWQIRYNLRQAGLSLRMCERITFLYLFSYIWFDKSGTTLRRAGLSMRMCERITVSRLWHLSLASRWGNYQSGHRLHLPWWNYTFCICPWWPNIPKLVEQSRFQDDVPKNVPRNTLLIFKPRNRPKFWKHLFNPVQRNCCEQSWSFLSKFIL